MALDYGQVLEALRSNLRTEFSTLDFVDYVESEDQIPKRGSEMILLVPPDSPYQEENRINGYIRRSYFVLIVCVIRTTQGRYTGARYGRGGTGVWKLESLVRDHLKSNDLGDTLDTFPGINLSASTSLDLGSDKDAVSFLWTGRKTEVLS